MELFNQAELLSTIHRAIKVHGGGPNSALQVCRHVQQAFSCIPAAAIPPIARELGTSTGHIVSLVTFYSFLHETARGQYDIYLSDCITDQWNGGHELLQRLCTGLGITPGEPRIDGRVTVAATSCSGLCDQGPAGLVNGRPLTRLTRQRVDQIVQLIESATPLDQWPREFFQLESHIQQRDLLLSAGRCEDAGLRQLAASSGEAMLAQLELSGLNGRGGAGFPTAKKWRFCKEAPGDTRYVICNADEGEPGTFKDRVLLTEYADAMIEGMTICARVVGAEHGFIYLRGEYAWLEPHLQWVLERRRGNELLGRNILGDNSWHFDIHIHLGAGAYVCGEESALIESLEGKRGTPRSRPPYPVVEGYLNKPTVVNNVETFIAAAGIAAHGGEWFARAGGTKVHSVSGDCARPGIYEFPVGTSVAEVIEAAGGGDAQAVQIAGAAGELLLPNEFHRPIDLIDIRTSGSFIVIGATRDLFDVTANFTRFFAHESCGFCAPCRTGTQLARSVVNHMESGSAFARDRDAVDRLVNVTPLMSHCGLGATALNPLRHLRDKCPDRYATLFQHNENDVLHFNLEQELSEIKNLTGEIAEDER